MRPEKKWLEQEYLEWLKSSPFFIVVDYTGMRVGHFNELRARLSKVGAEIHVVKNSIFRLAARENKLQDLAALLVGQLAVVIGKKDISAAAKVLKSFQAEFERPKIRFGFLGNQQLDQAAVVAMAELPSLEVLRGQLLGLMNAWQSRLVRVLKAPSEQLARVLKARTEKTKE